MADDKAAFLTVIDFIYAFLEFEHVYFGYTLSFKDILIGLFVLSLCITAYIKLTE